ncbi:hypothetical protein JOD45_000648 [Scopulibacillus daqui]|uniref:YfzA-like protein n=1 Tax=Scopulibacillus daqui TaxID=1469162 RepID=A0ABS2PXM1_9BACL|nr:hypothetical protein [Scopulibacillus daqui]MBM7644455.1 hypothetical protein [Scopulibacillus daqui]
MKFAKLFSRWSWILSLFLLFVILIFTIVDASKFGRYAGYFMYHGAPDEATQTIIAFSVYYVTDILFTIIILGVFIKAVSILKKFCDEVIEREEKRLQSMPSYNEQNKNI